MVVLEVYTKSVKVKYKAFLLSKATFVTLISHLIAVILPFVVCYETGGFWLKRDVVHEQPDVRLTGDFLFLATTSDNNQKPISCSSFVYYRKYTKSLDSCSSVKVRESDENHDGKADSLQFEIGANIPRNIRITSFYLILPLNYSLKLPCAFYTESAIILQQSVLIDVSQITIHADLGLVQSEPLKCSDQGTATNIGHHLTKEEDNVRSFTVENIIAKYAQSKIKTTMNNVLTTFIPTNADSFTISLAVKYHEHKIYFKPRLWQILKFAWIQYISIYIIISWIVSKIKSYIFKNNLVLLYEDKTDINKY